MEKRIPQVFWTQYFKRIILVGWLRMREKNYKRIFNFNQMFIINGNIVSVVLKLCILGNINILMFSCIRLCKRK